MSVLLQACLNGSRRPDEHPAVPITAAALAAEARAVVAAGAAAIHMHPRRTDGTESLAAVDIAAAVRSVRASCPGMPIGVSTGSWIAGGSVANRSAAVSGWAELAASERPDFASVNVHEPGFADLADLLQRHAIGVEPGVWSPADADALALVRPRRPWLRILVEVMDAPPGAERTVADDILGRLDLHRIVGDRLLHGEESTSWPLLDYAAELGLAARIGLEDVLMTDRGERAAGNAELVGIASTRFR